MQHGANRAIVPATNAAASEPPGTSLPCSVPVRGWGRASRPIVVDQLVELTSQRGRGEPSVGRRPPCDEHRWREWKPGSSDQLPALLAQQIHLTDLEGTLPHQLGQHPTVVIAQPARAGGELDDLGRGSGAVHPWCPSCSWSVTGNRSPLPSDATSGPTIMFETAKISANKARARVGTFHEPKRRRSHSSIGMVATKPAAANSDVPSAPETRAAPADGPTWCRT